MKTNNRGKLAIEITGNHLRVIFHPINGMIWMNRNELCELFGCSMKDIDRCIGDIFEKKMLQVADTCKYHIVAVGKRISYDITAVNLTVIITMAFRLETPETRMLRQWFVEQLSRTKSLNLTISDIGDKFQLN